MCLLSVSGIYRLIQSCCYLHWQLMDGSWLNCFWASLMFNGLFCNFELFNFVRYFVTNCQRGSLLSSKTLGTKCIRISICNVLANHDQNLESRFRLLKVCLVVKLESSVCRIYWTKSTRLNRSKIGLDRSNLAQIFFFFCVQNFQLSPSPYDV